MFENGLLIVNVIYMIIFFLIMLFVEIIKNGNCFNNIEKVCDGFEIFFLDGKILEEFFFL